jgi:hypothetical protein
VFSGRYAGKLAITVCFCSIEVILALAKSAWLTRGALHNSLLSPGKFRRYMRAVKRIVRRTTNFQSSIPCPIA